MNPFDEKQQADFAKAVPQAASRLFDRISQPDMQMCMSKLTISGADRHVVVLVARDSDAIDVLNFIKKMMDANGGSTVIPVQQPLPKEKG